MCYRNFMHLANKEIEQFDFTKKRNLFSFHYFWKWEKWKENKAISSNNYAYYSRVIYSKKIIFMFIVTWIWSMHVPSNGKKIKYDYMIKKIKWDDQIS
jgi:hypothetical protein